MPDSNRKGVLLLIVIGTILVVVTLSTVMLRIMLSQSRLTHHQVSRIQAQYAAKAGVIYALEKLRRNDDTCWSSGSYIRIMRKSGAATCVVIEPNLPNSVSQVDITVGDLVSGSRKISAKATYTYL